MGMLDKVLGDTLDTTYKLEKESIDLVPDSSLQREILKSLVDIKHLLRQIHKECTSIRYSTVNKI